ncbi:hypothetical protein [Winogradskyella luteola]|uniref:Uncharacterized protein n=1 Tax=Winogradskyella luteola TaxID=2828330 RepID=A0A9X1F8E7_9FLAO|nr:hypothetical protein [Winogradskyella luteola]MBV7269084.1 hypothetical protein [Winogradskyella luteola]
MRERLLTYLKYGNRFCGIEHTTKNKSDIIFSTSLKQSKKELAVHGSWESNSIEGIAKKLPKNQPILLILNNGNVLTKTIESEQQDSLKLVYKAFPNINLEAFYYEVLSQGKMHFIALCRKDYVDGIIHKYLALKVSIIDISLGNLLVNNISSFVNREHIFSSNAEIDIENNQVVQIRKKDVLPQSYDINGLNVNNQQLLPFSGALQIVLKTGQTQTNISDKKSFLESDFKQSRFFNLFLKVGGLFILSVLLINFFFFNHYFNKSSTLSQLSEINQSTKNQILKMDKIVSKKQKMVNDLLESNGSKSSFYSNSIIHSLPNSILLSELNFQPLLKRIKADKDIELKEKYITISGKSGDSEAFSDWISVLESKDWIAHIDIVDYGSVSSKTSDFIIEIGLSND